MGKLIKYEFRKQLTSKLIILAILGTLEVSFFIGILLDKESLISISAGLLMLTTMFSMFFLGVEAIITFSSDLKTKQSYMLFLVPRSTYQIVGAKMLTAIIQNFVALVACSLLGVLDALVVFARYGKIREAVELIKEMIQAFTGLEIDPVEIIWVLMMVLLTWLAFIVMAMLAITLSATLLSNTNSKWRGVISVVFFLVLNRIVNGLAGLLIRDQMFLEGNLIMTSAAWGYILFYVLVLVLNFFGTAYLLDRKISV